VDIMGIMGKPTGAKAKIKRYTLTDAAKPFAQEKEVASIGLNGKTTEKQTDLCWGKKALDKIVKWEGPMKFGDYQEAGITYTYKVNNLADNVVLFGLEKGRESAFAATYTEFGNVVVQQYPALVPTFPAVAKVVNTSYLQDIAGSNLSVATAELPSFDKTKAGRAVTHKRWHLQFDTARATFKTDAETQSQLASLKNTLEVQDGLLIQIDGYTDHQGTDQANRDLSEKRAVAVRDFLQQASPAAFPDTRFISVTGHGWDNPVASNATAEGKAQNRRVEILVIPTR
jgi:outer membrane protein OmpA-like peptidoglycan-associated protein